jgi:hypothetical protein
VVEAEMMGQLGWLSIGTGEIYREAKQGIELIEQGEVAIPTTASITRIKRFEPTNPSIAFRFLRRELT